MRRHWGARVGRFDICNVIHHKFSHGAVSYALNGENVNVVLELRLNILHVYQRSKYFISGRLMTKTTFVKFETLFH